MQLNDSGGSTFHSDPTTNKHKEKNVNAPSQLHSTTIVIFTPKQIHGQNRGDGGLTNTYLTESIHDSDTHMLLHTRSTLKSTL